MRKLLTITAVLSFCGVPAVHAQSLSDTLEIKESLVSAFRIDNTLASQHILSDKIQAAPNLADAIRLFSGIQIKDYGGVGGLKTINVRSLGSEHTTVMIDGIPVENAQNMQVDLGRFNTYSFSRIELSSNPYSGNIRSAREMGSGSSLNLSTDYADLYGKTDSFIVRLHGGAFGTFAPSASWRHHGKHYGMTLNASLRTAHGRYRFHETKYIRTPEGIAGYDTVMTRQNCDLTSVTLDWNLLASTNGRLKVKGYFYGSGRGLPGAVVRRPQNAITCKDRQDDRNAFLQASYEPYGLPLQVKIQGKVGYDYLWYRTDPKHDAQATPISNHFRQTSAYLSAAASGQIAAGLNYKVASDVLYNYLDSDMAGFAYPNRVTTWLAAGADYLAGPFRVDATLVYELARDWFRKGSDAGGWAVSNATRDKVSPSLNISWVPLLNVLRFSGYARRTYRLPSFNDLYYTMVGNSSLVPETADQFGLKGLFQYRFSRTMLSELEVEGYHNELDNKIVAIPTTNLYRWSMYNIGKARVNGIEAKYGLSYDRDGFQSDPKMDGFDIVIKYTWLRALDYSTPGAITYKSQIPYTPIHSGSVSASAVRKGWRIDLNAITATKRWYNSTQLPEYELDPYMTIDIWMSKILPVRDGNLTLRLSLNNILNEQYEVVTRYPMPGFNALGTIEYCF
ncbi:MAG: TonB-dependent receptor [Bacteroidales bacterium]|nr:TonB-dependent receptor [Bacteroidales bacterium]